MIYLIAFLLFVIACGIAPQVIAGIGTLAIWGALGAALVFVAVIAWDWLSQIHSYDFLFFIAVIAFLSGGLAIKDLFNQDTITKPYVITILVCLVIGSSAAYFGTELEAVHIAVKKEQAANELKAKYWDVVSITNMTEQEKKDVDYCQKIVKGNDLRDCISAVRDARNGKPLAPWFQYYVTDPALLEKLNNK